MIENTILVDETLDFNKSKQYWMSILFTKSGLSFVIQDTISSKLIAFKFQEIKIYDNLKEYCYFAGKLLKTETFLEYKYKNISIVFNTFKSTLVPEDLYTDEQKYNFSKINFEVNLNEKIVLNKIPELKAIKLFTVPSCILELINDNLPEAKIYHQTIPLIQSVLKNKAFNQVYITLNLEYFDLQIYSDKGLVLDNTFKYKTKEDILYYLLYTFDQLSLNPKHQKINIGIGIAVDTDIFSFLKKYFTSIAIKEIPKGINYSYLFSKEYRQQIINQILIFE